MKGIPASDAEKSCKDVLLLLYNLGGLWGVLFHAAAGISLFRARLCHMQKNKSGLEMI